MCVCAYVLVWCVRVTVWCYIAKSMSAALRTCFVSEYFQEDFSFYASEHEDDPDDSEQSEHSQLDLVGDSKCAQKGVEGGSRTRASWQDKAA